MPERIITLHVSGLGRLFDHARAPRGAVGYDLTLRMRTGERASRAYVNLRAGWLFAPRTINVFPFAFVSTAGGRHDVALELEDGSWLLALIQSDGRITAASDVLPTGEQPDPVT